MNKCYLFLLTLTTISMFVSCKGDATTSNTKSNTLQLLSEVNEPSKANNLLKDLNKEISELKNDDKQSFKLINKGLEV